MTKIHESTYYNTCPHCGIKGAVLQHGSSFGAKGVQGEGGKSITTGYDANMKFICGDCGTPFNVKVSYDLPKE